MTNNPPQPDIAQIRQLLLAAFTPEELRRFCYDRPTFRPVVNRFGRPYRLDDMADELIIYSDNYQFLSELLVELKQHNPGQYARYFEPELPVLEVEERQEDQPAKPTPKLVTVTRPFRLDLVRVPAGEFQMGSVVARDKDAHDDELPPHRVHVPEFHIGQYPVTNRQYRAFVQATGHRAPRHWEEGRIPKGKQNHPVVEMSWRDAVAFCDWLRLETGQPFRLPTEAEWEKAARGTGGRIYPWGDDPPDKDRCNFGQDFDSGDTTTIGRYSPQGDSPYGCADMAGNVGEWCQSLYEPYPYQADDGREDLQADGFRVLHGGAWWTDAASVRCAYRIGYSPDSRGSSYGLRVARGPLG
jgi:formylglycine-generating enzyme required for sulfatase activity